MRFRAALGSLLLAGVTVAIGCGNGEPSLPCVQPLDLACAPLYSPTYDEFFNRTLHPTCAQPGGSCHAAAGAQGGLIFEDADAAYALLLGEKDGRARVTAGDPSCSLLVERIASADKAVVMPPGGALSDAERCVVIQWIKEGARR
jgi:Planctomycete cytochrome C